MRRIVRRTDTVVTVQTFTVTWTEDVPASEPPDQTVPAALPAPEPEPPTTEPAPTDPELDPSAPEAGRDTE